MKLKNEVSNITYCPFKVQKANIKYDKALKTLHLSDTLGASRI